MAGDSRRIWHRWGSRRSSYPWGKQRMHAHKLLLRASLILATLAVTLAMGGPAALAASTIIIDDGTTADGCGETYNGKTALTNPVTAIGNAPSKSTVVICPGTYSLTGIIAITGKDKVTVKAAL